MQAWTAGLNENNGHENEMELWEDFPDQADEKAILLEAFINHHDLITTSVLITWEEPTSTLKVVITSRIDDKYQVLQIS